MLRILLLVAVFYVACSGGNNGVDAPPVDGPVDGPVDAAGSGSAAAIAMEASPKDVNLELMVVGLGMFIVAGPVRRTKRQRDTV